TLKFSQAAAWHGYCLEPAGRGLVAPEGEGFMRIGPSLLLTSRQTLAMTPQLQQAIKLLQFSHLELAAFIQQELERNPLLQEQPSDDGSMDEHEPAAAEAPADTAEVL